MVHEIKILPEYYQPVLDQRKSFEVRKNDRDYQPGDFILLNEFDGTKFTGRLSRAQILYVSDYQQTEGYVVFGFKLMDSYPQ